MFICINLLSNLIRSNRISFNFLLMMTVCFGITFKIVLNNLNKKIEKLRFLIDDKLLFISLDVHSESRILLPLGNKVSYPDCCTLYLFIFFNGKNKLEP